MCAMGQHSNLNTKSTNRLLHHNWPGQLNGCFDTEVLNEAQFICHHTSQPA